jgi:surface protein
MDVVTMKLVELGTVLPLDLVIFLNNFLFEKLTDENFKEAIALWFGNEEKCKWRFGHISSWNTSRVTTMERAFQNREHFQKDISRWDVSNVTNMNWMFQRATHFNGDLSHWNVGNVRSLSCMFYGATRFNGDLSHKYESIVLWSNPIQWSPEPLECQSIDENELDVSWGKSLQRRPELLGCGH